MSGVRITTWNVNGIRNPFGYQPWRDRRTFEGMFDLLEADIVVMQELKIQRKDLSDDMVLVPGWDCYFSLPKHKKGYSGVAIYTRQAVCSPIRAEEGLLGVLSPPGSSTPYRELPEDNSIGGYPTEEQLAPFGIDFAALDSEGRCVAIEFPAFVLLGVYSPANSSGNRDLFRYAFTNALDARIRNLDMIGKRVVLMGDLNVSASPLDQAGAEDEMKKSGLTIEEYVSTPNRHIFNQLLEGGDIVGERDPGRERPVLYDTCRGFHPGRKRMYTHWEQKINARPANYGSRIDYVLCSLGMKSWVNDANIQEGLMGSDHCPVYACLKDSITMDGKEVNIRDVLNPPGTFVNGERVREWAMKDLPVLCGRLLTEFDRRRTIKDMFARKPPLIKAASTADGGKAESASQCNEDERDMVYASQKTSSTIDGKEESPAAKPLKQPSQSPHPIRPKRSATEEDAWKPGKRTKSDGKGGLSAASGIKAQQSLRGFFKPKASASEISLKPTAGFSAPSSPEKSDTKPAATCSFRSETLSPPTQQSQASTTIRESEATEASQDVTQATPENQSPTKSMTESPLAVADSSFIDPIVSKESWMKLFTKPRPPRCEGHDEPCTLYKTKKSGINVGREFWLCPRPLGPTGSKERGTQWRCHTFVWASDQKGTT